MQFSNNISKELQESIRKTVSDTSNTEYFYYDKAKIYNK